MHVLAQTEAGDYEALPVDAVMLDRYEAWPMRPPNARLDPGFGVRMRCWGPAGMMTGWPYNDNEPEPLPARAVWRCNCGSDIFELRPTGAFCRRCGCEAYGWVDL